MLYKKSDLTFRIILIKSVLDYKGGDIVVKSCNNMNIANSAYIFKINSQI